MQRLYAPWRREYHLNKVDKCVFCSIINSNYDEENYVFYRDEICLFIMNKYPYNPAHFMIIPNRHIKCYLDLTDDEASHIGIMSKKAVEILKKFGANGINMGWNLGEEAGAGIAEHIHLHFVPRFKKDTNFMTTISETRVYSADFDKIFQEIKNIAKDIL